MTAKGPGSESILKRLARELPESVPQVRKEAGRDRGRVASWIYRARQDGVFRSGAAPSPKSLKAYRESILRAGWNYEIRIVERVDGKPIGYADWRHKARSAELLGLYLIRGTKSRDGATPASSCVRGTSGGWGHACLRVGLRGERDLDSRLSCRRSPGGPSTCREGDGKTVLRLSRRLSRFPQLGPRYSGYAALQGRNAFFDHVGRC